MLGARDKVNRAQFLLSRIEMSQVMWCGTCGLTVRGEKSRWGPRDHLDCRADQVTITSGTGWLLVCTPSASNSLYCLSALGRRMLALGLGIAEPVWWAWEKCWEICWNVECSATGILSEYQSTSLTFSLRGCVQLSQKTIIHTGKKDSVQIFKPNTHRLFLTLLCGLTIIIPFLSLVFKSRNMFKMLYLDLEK